MITNSDQSIRSKTMFFIQHTPVDHSINNNLDWVLISQKMNDLHSMFDNGHSLQFFSIVSAMHLKRVCEPLNNWALGLPETLDRVSSSCMGDICGVLTLDSDIVSKRNVVYLTTNKKN